MNIEVLEKKIKPLLNDFIKVYLIKFRIKLVPKQSPHNAINKFGNQLNPFHKVFNSELKRDIFVRNIFEQIIFISLIYRSPSPEPIYSSDGKRLNTREFRTRKRLEEQRHLLITRMQCMNPEFKPPSDYKWVKALIVFLCKTNHINFLRPPVIRVSDKVLIPQEENPDINFVGLLIGPRGNTLKGWYSFELVHGIFI